MNGRLGGLMTGAGISAGAGVEGVGQGGVEVEGCFECNNLAVSFKRLWDREAEDFADRTARAAGIRFEGPILASTRSLRSTAPSAGWDRSSAPGCSANSATIRTATTTPEHAGTTPVAARSPGHRERRRSCWPATRATTASPTPCTSVEAATRDCRSKPANANAALLGDLVTRYSTLDAQDDLLYCRVSQAVFQAVCPVNTRPVDRTLRLPVSLLACPSCCAA